MLSLLAPPAEQQSHHYQPIACCKFLEAAAAAVGRLQQQSLEWVWRVGSCLHQVVALDTVVVEEEVAVDVLKAWVGMEEEVAVDVLAAWVGTTVPRLHARLLLVVALAVGVVFRTQTFLPLEEKDSIDLDWEMKQVVVVVEL
jgi:hypothetical protein